MDDKEFSECYQSLNKQKRKWERIIKNDKQGKVSKNHSICEFHLKRVKASLAKLEKEKPTNAKLPDLTQDELGELDKIPF